MTNAISIDRVRIRLLLIGGMGGFLVVALAVPDAFDGEGLAFALGYLVVVLLHAGMYVHGTSVTEMRAILRIAPFNFVGVTLLLVGGALGGDWQWALWILAAALLWLTPQVTSTEASSSLSRTSWSDTASSSSSRSASRSSSSVGAAGLPLDEGLVLVALLALGLSAALWWVYFSDEEAVERSHRHAAGTTTAARADRVRVLALRNPPSRHRRRRGRAQEGDRAPLRSAGRLDRPRPRRAGAGLFILCDVGFRRTFGLERNRTRLVAAAAALATIPLGTELGAYAQVAAIVVVVAAALAAESVAVATVGSGGHRSPGRGAP